MSIRKKYEHIVEKGASLLMEGESTLYDQKTIVNKLTLLNKQVSTASFNKICKGKRVGDKILKLVAFGVQEIIREELGYEFDDATNDFIQNRDEGWQPTIIEEDEQEKSHSLSEKNGLYLHESGRIEISEKVKFMAPAQNNIKIVGVRLRQFCDYFTARSDAEFKGHIASLLEKGVNIDCYVLDPISSRASLYFEDRSSILPKERNGEKAIQDVIADFKLITEEFQQQNLKGKLSLYTYKHIPQNYFLIVDGELYNGKMQVSHYLFGVLRSKTPVLEIHKREESALFKLYMKSFRVLTKKASLKL